MDKSNAEKVLEFVENHYDYVSQEEWFDFCDMLLGMIVDSANKKGWAAELVENYPSFFRQAQ